MAFVHAVVFALVGPPAGSVAVLVPMLADDGADAALAALLIAGMSYLFGLVPALVAGAIAGCLTRLRPLAYLPLCAAIGGLAALGFAALIHFNSDDPGNPLRYMALPGALGGLVAGACTLPLRKWLRRAGFVDG